jgi:hypothetical protein
VAEHDHAALLGAKVLQGRPQGVGVLGRDAGRRCPVEPLVLRGRLPAPGAAVLVEMAVDDHPADVGVHRVGTGGAWPRHVELRECVLHDVLGAVRVTAQQVSGAEQVRAASGDVRREAVVP